MEKADKRKYAEDKPSMCKDCYFWSRRKIAAPENSVTIFFQNSQRKIRKSRTMCGLPLWKTFSLYWILFAENFTGHEKEEIRKGRNNLCRTKSMRKLCPCVSVEENFCTDFKKCIIKNFDKAGTAEIPEEAKERGI